MEGTTNVKKKQYSFKEENIYFVCFKKTYTFLRVLGVCGLFGISKIGFQGTL